MCCSLHSKTLLDSPHSATRTKTTQNRPCRGKTVTKPLGVSLPEQLSRPLVRHTAGAQARRVRGTEVVDAEVRHLRSSQSGMPHRLQSPLVSARVFITRKQPRTLSRESQLIPKRFDGNLGQWRRVPITRASCLTRKPRRPRCCAIRDLPVQKTAARLQEVALGSCGNILD